MNLGLLPLLLRVEEGGYYREFACSDAVHYAQRLGLEASTARACLRVARELKRLPKIRETAEAGEVSWKALRASVSKAVPETEERWLELNRELPARIIEKIAGRVAKGEDPLGPGPSGNEQEPVKTWMSFVFSPPMMALFDRAARILTEQMGEPLSGQAVLEALLAEFLTGQRQGFTWEQLLEEAEKDLAAAEEADSCSPGNIEAWVGVEAEETPVEGTELKTVSRPHWRNERLKFNGEARHLTPAQKREIQRRDCYRCALRQLAAEVAERLLWA